MIFQLMHIMEFLNDTSCLSFQSWVFRIFIEVSMIKIAFVSLFSLTFFLIRTLFFYFMNINVENRLLWHNGRVILLLCSCDEKSLCRYLVSPYFMFRFTYTFYARLERVKDGFLVTRRKTEIIANFSENRSSTHAKLKDMHPLRDKHQPSSWITGFTIGKIKKFLSVSDLLFDKYTKKIRFQEFWLFPFTDTHPFRARKCVCVFYQRMDFIRISKLFRQQPSGHLELKKHFQYKLVRSLSTFHFGEQYCASPVSMRRQNVRACRSFILFAIIQSTRIRMRVCMCPRIRHRNTYMYA